MFFLAESWTSRRESWNMPFPETICQHQSVVNLRFRQYKLKTATNDTNSHSHNEKTLSQSAPATFVPFVAAFKKNNEPANPFAHPF
jgi:hypothetical protein